MFGYPHLVDNHNECVERCAHMLAVDAFGEARGRGARLSFDAAVAYALQERRVASGSDSGQDSPLTRREDEVAELVAKGMSNKDIAGALVISARTAETHVEHILTKLGFGSRAQIATWVTARQRDADDGHGDRPQSAVHGA